MFSVVIPLYNKELSISNTIQSVLNQTFQDFEIVIVNDGSTDNSLKVVEQLNDSRIRIINKSNGGVSSARNRGVKEAKYEWIALLDGDDLWKSNYLSEMHSIIIDFHESKIFGCNYSTTKNGESLVRPVNLPQNFQGVLINYFDLQNNYPLFFSSAVIINKDSAIEIGGFDERISIGEDIDFWFRMILNYPNPVFYNNSLAIYNNDGENRAMMRKHDFSKSIMCFFYKFKEWEHINRTFAKFINLFYCRKIIDLFKNFDVNKKLIKDYLKIIDRSILPLRWKLFLLLPYFLKRYLSLKF